MCQDSSAPAEAPSVLSVADFTKASSSFDFWSAWRTDNICRNCQPSVSPPDTLCICRRRAGQVHGHRASAVRQPGGRRSACGATVGRAHPALHHPARRPAWLGAQQPLEADRVQMRHVRHSLCASLRTADLANTHCVCAVRSQPQSSHMFAVRTATYAL